MVTLSLGLGMTCCLTLDRTFLAYVGCKISGIIIPLTILFETLNVSSLNFFSDWFKEKNNQQHYFLPYLQTCFSGWKWLHSCYPRGKKKKNKTKNKTKQNKTKNQKKTQKNPNKQKTIREKNKEFCVCLFSNSFPPMKIYNSTEQAKPSPFPWCSQAPVLLA